MPKVTVFCGAASGASPLFESWATQVGKSIASHGHTLVYGGSRDGCMGAVANGALESGGKVIGVLPKFFLDWEIQNPDVADVIWTPTMPERKELLIGMADLILVLPGGYGTLDEMFEVITLTSLKRMEPKALLIFDPLGFYDGLTQWLEQVHLAGFVRSPPGGAFSVVRELSVLESFLTVPQSVS